MLASFVLCQFTLLGSVFFPHPEQALKTIIPTTASAIGIFIVSLID
jgi:hypothetical protein